MALELPAAIWVNNAFLKNEKIVRFKGHIITTRFGL